MLDALLTVGRDPIFGLTPGAFVFGLIVVVVVLAVFFWILRELGIFRPRQ